MFKIGLSLLVLWSSLSLAQEIPVIDVHTHANFNGELEETSKIPVTEAELKKEMKDAGVVAAISHTSRRHHKKFVDMRPINIFQCYGVTEKIDYKDIEKGLKQKQYQCLKIYLGYIHRYAYDKSYEPLYRMAKKYSVPVVFHTGDTYDPDGLLKYSNPLTIDEVAVKHRDVNFVIAHLGNPWIQSAAEVTYKNPNVYVEASAIMIGNLKKYSPDAINEHIEKQIRWAFEYIDDPKKFMFGTDWPLVHIGDYLSIYKRAIPKEHWRAVFYENAVKVFKIKMNPASPGMVAATK